METNAELPSPLTTDKRPPSPIKEESGSKPGIDKSKGKPVTDKAGIDGPTLGRKKIEAVLEIVEQVVGRRAGTPVKSDGPGGPGGPDGSEKAAAALTNPCREAIIDYLCEAFDWRELLPATKDDEEPEWTAEEKVSGKKATDAISSDKGVAPIIGSISTVGLQIFRDIQEKSRDPESLRDFICTKVAATIGEFERNREGSPEQCTDLLFLPLNRFVPPSGVQNNLDFVAGLRGYLDTQRKDQRELGWWATVGALGGWLGRAAQKPAKRHAVWYLHEVLRNPPTNAKTVDSVASTMTSILDDLADDNSDGLRVCNRIHALAIAGEIASTVTIQTDKKRSDTATNLFQEALGQVPQNPVASGLILAAMANIISNWRFISNEVAGNDIGKDFPIGKDWVMFMAAVAGTIGTQFYDPDDYRRISATFFNAGVWALHDSVKLLSCRIAFNLLGLAWAFRKAGADTERALVEYNGLDCSVNMFGAFTDLPGKQAPGSARKLADALVSFRESLSRKGQGKDEFFRLDSSWRELGMDPQSLANNAGARIRQSITSLLSETFAATPSTAATLLLSADDRQADQQAALVTAKLVRSELTKALPENFENFANKLIALFERLQDLSKDIKGAWDVLYADMVETGPLVAAKLQSADEWREIGEACINRGVASLGDFLTDRENLQWLG